MRAKSKTVVTWLALLGGALGAHRFYLRGWRDPWGWLHLPFTLLGLWGLWRARSLGQDDTLAWALLPLLGLSLSAAMLSGIVSGLTPDERWAARQALPEQALGRSGWPAVIGVILNLMLGAGVLMSTLAYSGQRYFEYQIQAARDLSQ